MKEIEHEVPGVGKFVLRKPKAGPRNKALVAAGGLETDQQMMKFLFAILPHCIKKHPWDEKYRTLPEACDDMESDEYDVLIKGAGKLFDKEGDAAKKSEQSSGEGESEPTTPSSPTSTSTAGQPPSEPASPGKSST